MVAAQQHRRYDPPFPHLRPRVLRPVEQPVAERVLDGGSLIAQHPGKSRATASMTTSAGSSPPDST